ncbi:MAG: leucine-rich repeat domain-containing protein, partial [Treponema sp.]|nr:leucine-rich repeat domain-containing protein [Treponema sp.]
KTAESRYLEAGRDLDLSLDAGEWEIRAYGLLEKGVGQPPVAVISGMGRVVVSEGGSETVLIVLDRPITESGEPGFLSWNIEYPREEVWGAALAVSLKIDENNFIPYTYVDLSGADVRNQKVSLPPGTYRMESRFLSHLADAGSTEIVHIYPGLETESGRIMIAGNIFPEAAEFSSVADLKTYLDTLPENTAAGPYPVKIAGVDLSSKEEPGETLKTLYKALNRHVTLDLRECTGAELISMTAYAGRKKIVSMILPDSITDIAENGFAGYEALESLVLPKAITIDYAAFHDLEKLETVSAPELTDLVDSKDKTDSASNGIFYKCKALKSIYFPKLETIGHHAFYACTGLTEAAFPSLQTVGALAFKGCTALKTASLPAVVKIDRSSFENDTALTHLILGSVPPELGTNVFKGGDFSQSGVIYVPTNAVDAYKNTALSNWSELTELVRPLSELLDL